MQKFKIGITNSPSRRWNQAYSGEYCEMRVIYRTSSWRNVTRVERGLIDHNWNCESCTNQRGGGAGFSGEGPYYLYVVISRRLS